MPFGTAVLPAIPDAAARDYRREFRTARMRSPTRQDGAVNLEARNAGAVPASPRWVDGPRGAWLEQVVVLVEHAIDQLVLEFVELPYLHRVEHSLHCELYSLLTANRTLGRPYPLADGTPTQLGHKEWPETVARPDKAGRRGNFDMVVLAPEALSRATIADFELGMVKPAIAIEIGLNYGRRHLEADVMKLANSVLPYAYVVHLARNPAFHHPEVVDGLVDNGARIAAALAGGATKTYRLLQSS
jgi:hypothetical protein